MVSRTDDETKRILDDVIILFVHANPDGNDLVADWYIAWPIDAADWTTTAANTALAFSEKSRATRRPTLSSKAR